MKKFLALAYLNFSLFANASAATLDQLKSKPAAPTRYQDIQAQMQKLAILHPGVVRVVDVGPSDSNETIQAVKIGDGPVHHLVVATHHGNEGASTKLVMALIESVAAHPISGLTIFVIPVLNIGGYNLNQRNEPLGVDNVDSNRDYYGPCGSEASPFILKSTTSLDHFLTQENIVAALTVHSPFQIAAYPWSFASHAYPNETAEFDRLAKLLAQYSGYPTGTAGDLVYYNPKGVFEDYAYWQYGIWAFLLEVGPNYDTIGSELDDIIKKNVPGILAFLTAAPAIRSFQHNFSGQCPQGSSRVGRDLHLE